MGENFQRAALYSKWRRGSSFQWASRASEILSGLICGTPKWKIVHATTCAQPQISRMFL
jgi:hypothetical protein